MSHINKELHRHLRLIHEISCQRQEDRRRYDIASLEAQRDAQCFNEQREAFLGTIPDDEERERVDILCRTYDSTTSGGGLHHQEHIELAQLLAKYPGMRAWLF